MPDTTYVYAFSIWPDESGIFHRALFDVMRLMQTRVEFEMTEQQFDDMRHNLFFDGFTVRACVRRVATPIEEVPS